MCYQKKYYDYIFKNLLTQSWDKAPGKDVVVNSICHYYNEGRIPKDASVVDIGCGSGFLLGRIYSEVCPSWNFVGVDICEEAVKKGKELLPHFTFLCEDGCQMNCEADTFDVLISYGAYEHFANPLKAIQEAGRILKKGGLFFMMLPSLGIYRTDLKDEGWYEELKVQNSPIQQLQWNLRRDTWEAYFSEAGLELWDVELSQRFGALKSGVFYFGEKPPLLGDKG